MEKYFAHPTAVIEDGCRIGEGVKIWHFCHLLSGCQIGNHCSLGQNVVVMPTAVLGHGVKVQNNVSIYDGVICEDDVFLGPSVVFTNVINPRSFMVRKKEYQKTLVKKGATIGANATILCGKQIGEYAMIGAGSVVTKDIQPYALVMGNPAKQTGWVSEFGHTLKFPANGRAFCPESGQEYQLTNGELNRIK
jgi:UDP-2-acetamido-3-amino-2,3-dideoxy-glucuronate N-acetyltransferase